VVIGSSHAALNASLAAFKCLQSGARRNTEEVVAARVPSMVDLAVAR